MNKMVIEILLNKSLFIKVVHRKKFFVFSNNLFNTFSY